jgi:hypothetical protein
MSAGFSFTTSISLASLGTIAGDLDKNTFGYAVPKNIRDVVPCRDNELT